jgi:uncharacterized repeat protein (TIGR03803 family)
MNSQSANRQAVRALTIAGALLGAALCVGSAQAWTLTTLHQFSNRDTDRKGKWPASPLLIDASGNLYGTTVAGGAYGYGTVFQLTYVASKDRWRFAVLHDFSDDGGATPVSRLIIDKAGNIFGAAQFGGPGNGGTVFELSPPASGNGQWVETVIYAFCIQGGEDCPDGRGLVGDLTYAGDSVGQPYDGVSPFYGTTGGGGVYAGGTVFELTPGTHRWRQKTLYPFCSQANCTDGKVPWAGVTLDQTGNLYGTATEGGLSGAGVAFELSHVQGNGWTQTVLHHFCAEPSCSDGSFPEGTLVIDGSGELYGGTQMGGGDNRGVLFKLTSAGGTWQETVLHDFCSWHHCRDGGPGPTSLILDGAGNLFGTTFGQYKNYGNVFELTKSKFKVLYSFCSIFQCSDGADPRGGVVLAPTGRLYGTTISDGGRNAGTVFELSP